MVWAERGLGKDLRDPREGAQRSPCSPQHSPEWGASWDTRPRYLWLPPAPTSTASPREGTRGGEVVAGLGCSLFTVNLG